MGRQLKTRPDLRDVNEIQPHRHFSRQFTAQLRGSPGSVMFLEENESMVWACLCLKPDPSGREQVWESEVFLRRPARCLSVSSAAGGRGLLPGGLLTGCRGDDRLRFNCFTPDSAVEPHLSYSSTTSLTTTTTTLCKNHTASQSPHTHAHTHTLHPVVLNQLLLRVHFMVHFMFYFCLITLKFPAR